MLLGDGLHRVYEIRPDRGLQDAEVCITFETRWCAAGRMCHLVRSKSLWQYNAIGHYVVRHQWSLFLHTLEFLEGFSR